MTDSFDDDSLRALRHSTRAIDNFSSAFRTYDRLRELIKPAWLYESAAMKLSETAAWKAAMMADRLSMPPMGDINRVRSSIISRRVDSALFESLRAVERMKIPTVADVIRDSMPASYALHHAFPRTDFATLIGGEDRGALNWRTEDDELVSAPIVSYDDDDNDRAPGVALHFKVQTLCLRCKSPMFNLPAKYTVTDVSKPIPVNLEILGFCPCMKDWNGSVADLFRSKAPKLRLVDGGAEGDGTPRASLRIVESDDEANSSEAEDTDD